MSKIIKCWKLNYFPRLLFWESPFQRPGKESRGVVREQWALNHQASLRLTKISNHSSSLAHGTRKPKFCKDKQVIRPPQVTFVSVAKVFRLLVHWAIFSRCRTLHPSYSQKSLQPQGFLYLLQGSGTDSIGSTSRSHSKYAECYRLNVGVTHSPKFIGLGPNLNSLWELIKLRGVTRVEPP